jgi:hypothetical protein
LERVVVGAKTPTMQRAVAYEAGTDVLAALGLGSDQAVGHGVRTAAKWSELSGPLSEDRCLTIIYGNQYLDFEVAVSSDDRNNGDCVSAVALGQWLVWVTVLASMNAEMSEADDDAFGGMVTPMTPRSGRRGSAGVNEASDVSCPNVYQAAEYGAQVTPRRAPVVLV